MSISPQALIIVGGIGTAGAVVFHLLFWRLFDWPNDLKSTSFINRRVIQILNICLTLVFVIWAYISLAHTEELLTTELGRSLLLMIAVFWWLRAAQQVYFFPLKHPGSLALLVASAAGGFLYAAPWYMTQG